MKLNCHVKETPQRAVTLWNMRHKVGTTVSVILADGSTLDGKTASQAWMLGASNPVVSVYCGPFNHGVYDLKNIKESNA